MMYDAIGRVAFVGIPAVAEFYLAFVVMIRHTEGLEGVPRALLWSTVAGLTWAVGSTWWVVA